MELLFIYNIWILSNNLFVMKGRANFKFYHKDAFGESFQVRLIYIFVP